MPDSVAFSDAIQTPQLFHSSVGDVKSGSLRLNQFGIPVPNSGNFAVVFQSEWKDRSYALRCFSKPAADQDERLREIMAHLKANASHYFVAFEYYPQGLLVGGQWQPLMIMEWKDGVPFEKHVQSLLNSSEGLLNLAGDWVDMFEYLRSIDLAHGDIHSDNVIVDNGQLVLIDYDAIYIPKLAGRTIQEAGQRNFQHPGRNQSHYGPYMDHFPSWLVYFSLILLSVQPDLWDEFDGGDQKLLFSVDDYQNPDKSKLFSLLQTSKIAIFPLIASKLRSFLAMDIRDVPPLSRYIIKAGGLPLPPQPPLWWVNSQVASDWYRDHLDEQKKKPRPTWPPKN